MTDLSDYHISDHEVWRKVNRLEAQRDELQERLLRIDDNLKIASSGVYDVDAAQRSITVLSQKRVETYDQIISINQKLSALRNES